MRSTRYALLGLLVLAASIPGALWAYGERQPHRDHSRFVDPDPLQAATEAAENGWLGRALAASELALAEDPENPDRLRMRIRNVFRLAAVVVREQHLKEVVTVQAQLYLLRRNELDPDGSFLQQVLREYADIRLALPLPMDFYARIGTAVYLAGKGDERAKKAIWEISGMGPLYTEMLQFARRYYNGSVREYNTRTETVPSNIVAGWFRFTEKSFFQKSSDDVANVPLVKLGKVE